MKSKFKIQAHHMSRASNFEEEVGTELGTLFKLKI